jgi:hypothetical protein
MKLLAATIMLFFMLTSNAAHSQTVSTPNTSQTAPVENSQTNKITRNGSQQPNKGLLNTSLAPYRLSPFFLRTIHHA